jgi:integrase
MDSENLIAFKPPQTAYHRLSAAIVAKSMPRQKEYFVRDTELRGFFLRVRPSGVKSYGVLSRLGRKGNKIERIIGDAAVYSPKKARDVAKEWLVQFDQGVDPKATDKGAITPAQLLEQYITSKNLKPRTVRDYRYNFQHYLKPLNSRKIQNLTTDDIVRWYSSGGTHATGTERTFVVLKAVLDYAFALGYISENPARKAALLVKRKVNPSKQQHLSEIYDDLSKFMDAFLTAPVSNVMRDWMVFCLTTGLRKQESMSVKWEQVDLVQKRVTLPTNKSDRFLIVPMVGLTYDMFQSRFNAEDKDDVYVFTSKPAIAIKDARKALTKVCKSAGIATYSHHDFRRLFASVCHELDISETEIGKLLNHAPKTVTPIYINQSLEKARKKYQQVVDALDRKIPFDDTDRKKSEYFLTATNLMRSTFYGKASVEPDAPVTSTELQESAYREAEYWEG